MSEMREKKNMTNFSVSLNTINVEQLDQHAFQERMPSGRRMNRSELLNELIYEFNSNARFRNKIIKRMKES